MSTKTKTKSTTQQQQTNAPPAWTAPGLKEVAGSVMDALHQQQALPDYTGDFVAQQNAGAMQNVMSQYQGAADLSGIAGNQFWGNYHKLKNTAPTFGQAATFNPFDIQQGPAVAGMDKLLGGGQANSSPGYVDPTILDRPDFASMAPTLAAAPQFRQWTPEAFVGDDGGARLDSALSAATQPFVRELMNKILPGIRSSAIESGAYTGDRAMSVLPGQAIADTAGRANEVTQGLAYQGFQQEQDRAASTWAQLQQMMGQSADQENDFNSNIWSGTNDFNLGVFGTRAGAENSAYSTAQQAQLAAGQQKNAWGLDKYNTDTNAALTREGMVQDQYQNWISNQLQQGQVQNQSYGLQTERGLGAYDAGLAGNSAARQALMDSLSTKAAAGDIQAQMMQMLLSSDQAGIDNNLAKYQYGQEAPWAGLDTASALLAQLSGNYGTQNSSGTSTSTQTTSGMGPIVQGLMGAAMGAAGLGAFGGGLGNVAKFSPVSTLFNTGAKSA